MQLKSGHRHALCRDGDVLLGLTAGDDPQRIVRQRPLQRLRLILMSALRSLATGSFWRVSDHRREAGGRRLELNLLSHI